MLRFLFICVLAGSLAGCAAPVGVLEPVAAEAPGATRLDILVATTRSPSPDNGVAFTGERGGGASLSSFVVSIPPDGSRQVGRVQWPQQTPPDPSREFAVLGVESLRESQFDDWLRKHGGKSRRALVFIHGFNTRFESALMSLAQIAHDSGAEAAPVLFSWPSRGSLFEYSYDRESANASRDALEKLLARLAANPAVGEITVLAHSMGAWLTMESLRQMAIRRGRLPAQIRNVILASPDIDVDVFRTQFASLGQKHPRVIVFVSRRDRALQFSRSIAGNIERLGVADPREKPWIEEKGIEVIDLTDVDSSDLTRHSKFAENPDVVRFLGAQLINGGSPGEAEAGVGERLGGAAMGLAQGVAGATGLALSAPIAVVDPKVRRAYSNQLEQVRQAVDNAVASGADR
ncbi:alpha/beta hydrolase [Methylocystis parvus]|uniref:alpha/beta hydrolase n=1 Tax=Methylocystis parvus TaxID=134 RepID=UPI003C78DF43